MAEVPPLEDVPDILDKLQERANEMVEKEKKSLQMEHLQKLKENDSSQKTSSTFGGLKKGFLFGGGGACKKNQTKKILAVDKDPNLLKISETKGGGSKDSTCLPFIRAKDPKSSLVLSEVQDALVEANVANDFQNKLAQRLESHSDVKDVLSDPAWIPILDEFQRDPQAAMIRYKDCAKIKKTLLRLCDVLGDTFLHMDTSTKSEEERLSGQLMEDPQVKEALLDPLVVKICAFMKEGANDKVHKCIQKANPEQKRHIQTLIDFGLFSFSM